MSDRRYAATLSRTKAPLTPEVLATMIRITAPEGIVAVQGIVVKLSEPRNYGGDGPVVYGELALGGAMLSFRVPAELAPQKNEAVIIEGYLRFQVVTRSENDSWRGNWKVTLVGQVVGNWTPRATPEPVLALPERGPRVSLNDFVSQHGIGALLVLSTHTGQRDLVQSIASGGRSERPAFQEANFGNADAFLKNLASIPINGRVRGLAIVRGGGAGLDVIGGSREIVAALIDKGMPFYTALGHDIDIVLADRSADQVFHSPSELGTALARAAKLVDDQTQREARLKNQSGLLDKQTQQLEAQSRQIAQLKADANRVGEVANARVAKLRTLLIGTVILLAILIWLLVRR